MASSLASRPAPAAGRACPDPPAARIAPLRAGPPPCREDAADSAMEMVLLQLRAGRLEMAPAGSAPTLADPEGALLLPRRRLAAVAARLSGHAWPPHRFEGLLEQPIVITGADAAANAHLRRLVALLELLEGWGLGPSTAEAQRLGMEEVIDRLVVLALWGDWLIVPLARRGGGPLDRNGIIEELVTWIQANCRRPIVLEELEQRSGYSQRSLRNAFQERFGCAPKEWIRRTRMESARRRMLDAQAGDTVSSIAQEHGYSHVSQFSRDFRSVFGLQPSVMMRRARRSVGIPPGPQARRDEDQLAVP